MFIDLHGRAVDDGASVLNGRGQGPVGEALIGIRYDPGMMQPYFNRRGQRAVTINTGRMVPNKDGATER